MSTKNREKTSEENIKDDNNQTFFDSLINGIGKKGKYMSERQNFKNMLVFSLGINFTFFLIIVILGISYGNVLKDRDVSIIVPPGTYQDMSLSFGSTRVNRKVFEMYADFLSRGFGNINYENVDKVYDKLLYYTDGTVKHQTHSALINNARLIKDNFVTQIFRLDRIELDRDSRGTLAKCYGYVTRKIGSKTQYENMPYLMTFWFKSYRGNVSMIGMSSKINRDETTVDGKIKVDKYETDNKYINF